MRDIMFRGKAANRENGRSYRTSYKNGDWVYGLLTNTENYAGFAEMTNTDGVCGIEVDKSTVGQFTSLTDRNGTKIFEGDVVRDEQSFLFGKVVYVTPQDGFDGLAGFMVDDVDDGLQNYNGFWHNVEVVGNIHDNPELLEVTDDA